MQVTIRPAEPRDVPAMLALVKELAVFEKEPDAVTVTEGEMREAGFGPNPVWFGWVACRSEDQTIGQSEDQTIRRSENEGEGQSSDRLIRSFSDSILGMAVCYERYSTWKGRRLYLEDIIVTEAARGQRIGEKLFLACVRHAVEQGYSGMRWQVLDWNTDAIRFYERFGAEVSAGWLNGDLTEAQLRALVG